MELFADDQDSAFLDVAANTLAIIIIVTVFSLAVVRAAVPTASEPDAVQDPRLVFRPGERNPFPPPSLFVLFMDGRSFVLDGDSIHDQLALHSPGPALRNETPQGLVDFIPLPASGYDIDVYQLTFAPDPGYVAGLPILQPADVEVFVDGLEHAFRTEGHAPTFLVYPSGMDAFAAAHEALAPRTMPWRWTLVSEGQPVRIERSVRGFRSFTTYW